MALTTFDQAKKCLEDPHACLKLVTSTRHLALLPKYLGNIRSGIQEYLDSEVHFTSKSFDGVPIAYCNVKRLQRCGRLLDDAPSLHFEIQAEFIVFQPTVDSILKGVVNKISSDHVGCLVHGRFNASIPKPRPEGRDWPGFQLQIGEEFLFRVLGLNSHNRVLSINGVFHESLTATNEYKTPKKRKHHEVTETTPEREDDTDIPFMVAKKKHKRKHSMPDFLPFTSTPYRPEQAVWNSSERDASQNSVFDTTDLTGSDSQHKKKKKKKKHRRDVDSEADADASVDTDLSTMQLSSIDIASSNRTRSYSPDAPSDVTHDSGIMSVDSDAYVGKTKKSKKRKSKVKD